MHSSVARNIAQDCFSNALALDLKRSYHNARYENRKKLLNSRQSNATIVNNILLLSLRNSERTNEFEK